MIVLIAWLKVRNLPKIEKGKKKERQRKESGGQAGQQRSDSEASSSVSGDQDMTEVASRKSASSVTKDLDPVVEEEADN